MAAGRPTKYKKEYCALVDEYILENQDEEINSNKIKVKLPTIGGFALFINTPERTVYDWKDAHEEFSQSLEKIVKEQQKRLINSGLSGEYNSTIAKLILSSNHGMSDKVSQDINNPDGNLKTIIVNKHGSNDKPST